MLPCTSSPTFRRMRRCRCWVAVGDPARILPPEAHDEIWAIQEPLNFPKEVFGVDRPGPGETRMPEIMARYCRALSRIATTASCEDRRWRKIVGWLVRTTARRRRDRENANVVEPPRPRESA